ncbi:outer membrane beta-barrel protein [Cytophagales bacterium LB-30]|uniref:Outer membrane beta-barrel protein n=1 Tax=Shiella aurantiaca TaxID=3058365 RepID=A0ABT8F0G9_9BACT|nr:outer membrane beta-barrel protein [Shiella aurantiaca]MDN4163933.1 outer membrane beta-barrel protein [Shiella aurantiaca]
MRKHLLIIFLLASFTLSAQDFHFRFGANLANLVLRTDTDNDPVNQYVVRPMFGLAFEAPITDKLIFRPEFLYSEKGLKIRPRTGKYPQSSFRLGYLEAPLFFSFNTKISKDNRFMLDIGPYFALGFTGSYKTVTYDFNRSVKTTKGMVVYYNEVDDAKIEKIEDDVFILKRVDFGFKFGFGFQFKTVSVHSFYSRGFVNTIPKVTATGYEQNKDREYNSVITLALGFLLNEKKESEGVDGL